MPKYAACHLGSKSGTRHPTPAGYAAPSRTEHLRARKPTHRATIHLPPGNARDFYATPSLGCSWDAMLACATDSLRIHPTPTAARTTEGASEGRSEQAPVPAPIRFQFPVPTPVPGAVPPYGGTGFGARAVPETER